MRRESELPLAMFVQFSCGSPALPRKLCKVLAGDKCCVSNPEPSIPIKCFQRHSEMALQHQMNLEIN